MTAYVALIGHDGYHVIKSYDFLETAMQDALARNSKTFLVVVRDGVTGKRYSQDQCRSHLQRQQPDSRKRRNR